MLYKNEEEKEKIIKITKATIEEAEGGEDKMKLKVNLSDENKYRLKKIRKVILWTLIPYLLIKVPQELLKLPAFAEYSFILNVVMYSGKIMKEEPTKTEMRLEGIK